MSAVGTPSLYLKLKRAGCEIDSWQSDLYVRDTPEVRAIIQSHDDEAGKKTRYSRFTSQRDGNRWVEVPFGFEPYWASRSLAPAGDPDAEWVLVGHLAHRSVWLLDGVFATSESDGERPTGFHGRVAKNGFRSLTDLAIATGLDPDDYVALDPGNIADMTSVQDASPPRF